MHIIQESFEFEDSGIVLSVINNLNDDWRIIDLDTDISITEFTPDELINLGNWFMEKGKYIKFNYNNLGEKIK